MVGYPFLYRDPTGFTTEVKYSVGNPMGFYTSWAAFTISHHLVLYICEKKAGVPRFSTYKILGDDLVIWNDKVATYYKEVCTEIGVEISEMKTHISSKFFEFAKRCFTPFGEISPFSFPALFQESKSMFSFRQLLDLQREKG